MIRHDALILSGGGAHGCWEAGFLYEVFGKTEFGEIWGTSVGGLNALAWMQATIEGSPEIFKRIWLSLRGNKDIYSRNYLKSILMRPPYSYAPLRKLLRKHIQFERIAQHLLPICLVATDLVTGQSIALSNQSLHADELLEAAVASANFPPVFPPVELRQWKFVDGGLRANVPVMALRGGKSGLMLVCTATTLPKDTSSTSMVEIGLRSVDIMMNEITSNDIEMTQTINEIVRTRQEQGKSSNKEVLCLDVYEPEEPLPGTALDFDPERIRAGFDMGRRQGVEWLNHEIHKKGNI